MNISRSYFNRGPHYDIPHRCMHSVTTGRGSLCIRAGAIEGTVLYWNWCRVLDDTHEVWIGGSGLGSWATADMLYGSAWRLT